MKERTAESISIKYAMKNKKLNLAFLVMTIYNISFDRSIDNHNFQFKKKKLLLVIDNKTNSLNNKTTPKRINERSS